MFSQWALEDVSSLGTAWVTESITSPLELKQGLKAEMEGPFQSRTMARECRWVPRLPVPAGARRRPAAGARPCQLAGKATAGGSGTVINEIIIRNKPQALAECLRCHAGAAYPALGSLARPTWGCSRSPNHTRPGGNWAGGHG